MSVKHLLSKLFDVSDESSSCSNLNVSLQQGNNYNNTQSQIRATVTPQLALIEQTSNPKLSSIVENFSNMSTNSALVDVNTKEYKELVKIENDFNSSLANYTQKQQAYMQSVPKSSEHATAKGQMELSFTELQSEAASLKTTMDKLNAQKLNLNGNDGAITIQKRSTRPQIAVLHQKQNILNKLMTEGDTLEGELEDNKLQMRAEYIRYFVWFSAAVTLGLVAFHKTNFYKK